MRLGASLLIFSSMPAHTKVTSRRLSDNDRIGHTATLFGSRFLFVESYAFDTASSLSADYTGGLWDFYTLSNGGFYMVPADSTTFRVCCDNGFEGDLSA